MNSFNDFGLTEPILRALAQENYVTPTPIQAQTIAPALAGRDIVGIAQTGSGKTAAFALPILHQLAASPRRPERKTCRVLVLSPTRELSGQILDSFNAYGRHLGLATTLAIGGVPMGRQVRALMDGVDVLVATPGRLLDLMGQRLVSLARVEVLVLDEADRMLDMAFLPDIRRILAEVPRERQTLFFSATMPDPIRKLSKDILRNPATVQVARVSSPVPTVTHWVYHVEKTEKPALLTRFLASTPHTRVLVFARTKHGANKLTRHLVGEGVPAAALHGNKSQAARTRALADFRSAQTPVLVATDIAARGLDVEDISHVVNYDLTSEPETYVHRIGRTGRAGAAGTAVSFCSTQDRENLREIERLIRTPLQPVAELPRQAKQARQAGQTMPARHDVPAGQTMPARSSRQKPHRAEPARKEPAPMPEQPHGTPRRCFGEARSHPSRRRRFRYAGRGAGSKAAARL